ncbi:hypothetical protein B0J18DRAFT_439045 [Chaetomium sp. MPI-SDFR-AT-0129]|nr:hypothetical protein B0J18DRAFT_439045 [Chaetomium sp. MPI-SDFR-AT-0129]
MSKPLATRTVPLLIAATLFGGLAYSTWGGTTQPRPRVTHDARSQASVSERLQSAAGTGGVQKASGSGGDSSHEGPSAERLESLKQYDPKDTRLFSNDPAAQSKRNPDKARSGELDRGGPSPGGGLGKNIGEREEGKEGDLAWKKIGGSH